MNLKEKEPGGYEAFYAVEIQVSKFNPGPKLRNRLKFGCPQIIGCGFCLNMHTRDAKKLGQTEQRLYTVSAWWERPFFTEKEQAASKLAEEVTLISAHGLSDEVYEKAVGIFGEQRLAQLILVIIAINGWNRIALATHLKPD